MVYTPLNWKNREVERPRTFQLQNNSDGTVTLIPKEGAIVEPGTPIIADNMNRIEQGIVEVSNAVGNGVADYVRQPAFAGTAGTATAYTVTLSPAPTSIPDGFGITIIPHATSGSNPTLNVNGLGAFPLKKQNGSNYPIGKLVVGNPYTFRKVGTDFLADSTGGNGDALVSDVRAGKKFTNDENDDLTGSLAVRATGVTTITPGPSVQSLLPGIYDNTITINSVSVPAAKVLNDTTIAGTKGTVPIITTGGDPAQGVGIWPDGALAVYPSEGYRKGGSGAGEIKVSVAQLQSVTALQSENIRNGERIFGVTGSLTPKMSGRVDISFGSGSATTSGKSSLICSMPAGTKKFSFSGGGSIKYDYGRFSLFVQDGWSGAEAGWINLDRGGGNLYLYPCSIMYDATTRTITLSSASSQNGGNYVRIDNSTYSLPANFNTDAPLNLYFRTDFASEYDPTLSLSGSILYSN